MSNFSFKTQAEKDAAIAAQKASTNEEKSVHDKHLADLEAAVVTG